MDGRSQEITSLVGREVYSTKGVFVGEVEDVRLDIEAPRLADRKVTGLALREVSEDLFDGVVGNERGVVIPYQWVRAVGDVVLISDTVEHLGEDGDEANTDNEVIA